MSLPIFKDHDPENPWVVTGESHVIDSKGIISLEYIPLNGSISMDYFTFTNNQLSISSQQFYIDYSVATDYKGATGKVYFNPVNAGTKVIVAYQGVSQLIKAAYMNEVKSHVEDAFKHTPPPASASSFLKSTPGDAPVWNLINWEDIQDKPNFSDASWKAAVNTPADLPLSGNHIGDMRVVLNDGDSGAIFECITATGDLVAQWAKIGDFSFATPAWTAVTNKPTTLNGYGITDALPALGTATKATKLETARNISVTGDATGTATFDGSTDATINIALKNSNVTAATYKGGDITVNPQGIVTGAEQGVAGFILATFPAGGVLASALAVIPYACTLNLVDIKSTKKDSIAAVTPSASTTISIYKNGSSYYSKPITAASTTDTTASLSFATGDTVQILQSAVNSTEVVTLTARGVRA